MGGKGEHIRRVALATVMTQSLLVPVLPRAPHLSAGRLPLLHQGTRLHLSSFCFFLSVAVAFPETLG